MIQKIRSYLLDNEDHKDSIGWLVAILMLAPMIGIIIQYRKTESNYIGSVNSKNIEKSVYYVRLFEQKQLMENINKMFGEEQASYFFDILFQGKTLEEYILSSEIRRNFSQELFEKLISDSYISDYFILDRIKKKALNDIKGYVGELPFLLITGQIKPSALGQLNIDIKKIDSYCKEVFQVILLNNSLIIPLSLIEKYSLKKCPSVPLKINFTTFTYHLKQNDYRKKVDINKISDNEMRICYDKEIKSGNFRKDRKIELSINSYSEKVKDKKLLKENNDEKESKLKKELEEINASFGKDYLLLSKELRQKFDNKVVNQNITIEFNDEKKEIISKNPFLSEKIKAELLSYILKNINKKDLLNKDKEYICFVEKDNIYCIKLVLFPFEYFSFEQSKEKILDIISLKREDALIQLDINKIRYDLEAKRSVDISCWKKEEIIFEKSHNNEDKSKDNSFYKLVSNKIINGGLKKDASFVECFDGCYKIYFINELSYEENDFISRKDQFINEQIFVESIERFAKIKIKD